MKEIGVGIIGFGTVGAGVANGLLNEAALIARRCGVSIVLKGIADLDIETDRGVVIPRELLSTDAM
ncbi:MAG: homoserine dehydrogenase, partial [Kiritimatiellia bacterium]